MHPWVLTQWTLCPIVESTRPSQGGAVGLSFTLASSKKIVHSSEEFTLSTHFVGLTHL